MATSARDHIDRGASAFEAEIERLGNSLSDRLNKIDELENRVSELESELAGANSELRRAEAELEARTK